MFTAINEGIDYWARKFSQLNPYTNVLGCFRSVLATGTIITLLFNNWELLFPFSAGNPFKPITVFDQYNYFYVLGFNHLSFTVIIALLILFMVVSGIFPQITCVLHFWVTYSFYKCCPVIEGGDQLASILTLFLIPILIFDNRRFHWDNPITAHRPYLNLFANNVIFFIQLQVSIVYLHAFVGKLSVKEWLNGTDIYYWFTHNIFGFSTLLRPLLEPLMKNQLIVTSLTWGDYLS